jgi:hypothetical protein
MMICDIHGGELECHTSGDGYSGADRGTSGEPGRWRTECKSITIEGEPADIDCHGVFEPGSTSDPFPAFNKKELKIVQNSIDLAADMTKKKDCDEALKDNGIPSLAALVNGLAANGNIFDGRTSSLTGPIADDGSKESVAEYFDEKKESVGAAVFDNSVTGRGPVTFLGDYFFNPTSTDWTAQQRAIMLIHEAVHAIGGKGDSVFGGSKKLSEKIINKCYPVLKGRLGGVG